LVKVDRAAMSVALEGRDPFLDHKITEFAAGLPMDLKYKNGVSKYILKKILYRHIPRELVDRPKQGFGVPVYEWFRDELKGCYREHLDFGKIKREGIFDADAVSSLLDGYLNDRGVNAYKLWFLFVFELWYEKYML
ncbi:MAG TPA: asparagine synthase C-terminal domain-containing protein, partial [Candidatus Wallbacteria bacterium]|nr:asparagine synthase C-terminal domain-containing protein [Candidatus Wallbacteria bacterium]